MEYKYQIGEIVFAGDAMYVVAAHGVYLDGENTVPSYHVTTVNEAIGTRTLPLTDMRIHRNSSMKSWLREDQLCGQNDYVSGLIQKLEAKKAEGERLLRDTEEKIKRFKDLLNQGKEGVAEDVSKTQEDFSPRKYVVRVTTPHKDGLYVSKHFPLGASVSHKYRGVFDTLSEAWQVRSAYNNQAYRCHAVVVPDGTEDDCRNAEPVEVNSEE